MRRWIVPLLIGLAVAVAAYFATIAATPRALMAVATRHMGRHGFNHMLFPDLPDASARAVVRPSPDLSYAACPFDLSDGPLLVEAAPVPSPYWSLSVFDAETDAIFVRNNRQSAGKPIRIVVARKDQTVPQGVKAVRTDHDRGIALIRILVQDRARFGAIDTARQRSRCTTLHR